MSKKRRTRREKILAQLRKKLTQNQASQEAILNSPNTEANYPYVDKKADITVFSFDPKLIRKDLIKVLVLALAVFSFEAVLYWWLK